MWCILQTNIKFSTTKFGKMEKALVLEKDDLILYEQYIRKHKETKTFGSLLGLRYGASKTGYEREFTFDLDKVTSEKKIQKRSECNSS
jgi:hypothetical protein